MEINTTLLRNGKQVEVTLVLYTDTCPIHGAGYSVEDCSDADGNLHVPTDAEVKAAIKEASDVY